MSRRIRLPSWENGECAIPTGCRFDVDAADRASEFFPRYLRHSKGRFAGKPFHLLPFQEQDIREVFGRVDDRGNRVVRTVFKLVPKKNGKSAETAGVGLKLLFADDEPGAEIYGAAADRSQASIVFDVALQMVRRSRAIGRLAGIKEAGKRIVFPEWESFYQVISSEVASKHGYNSHGVLFDEVHAQKDNRLWEALTFGAGSARTQPLVWAITTSGVPGESPVAEMLFEEADQILRGVTPCPLDFYPVIYAAPDDADWRDEKVWLACNPAMGTIDEIEAGKAFLSIELVRADEFARALRRPDEQNSFRRLRLNQWTKQETRFIDMADWDRCSGAVDLRALKHLTWYGALDLSTKLDVTALVLCALDGNGIFHVIPYFWLPKDNIADRPNQECSKYQAWAGKGLIRLTEGNVVDYTAVERQVLELRDTMGLNFNQIGFDPWNATHIAQRLQETGFEIVEIRQGYRTLSEPTKELQSATLQGNVRHGGHPVLRWMADCMTVRQDENGNVRPVKPDRRKSAKRIDGMVALIMAMSQAMRAEIELDPYANQVGLRVI